MSQPATIDTSQLTAAHDVVEDVVVKARTSFYWAMRLLPAEKRQAMFAVYAFCRVVDDIADGELPGLVKLRQLQEWREEIDRLYAGDARDPIARALIEPVRRFGLAREDFIAMIDGMENDARGGLIAPPMAELELYCSRVAGAVGLLSVRIFGAPQQGRRELARTLGEAVQLTNVLRDLGEDADLGRLYLPREFLEDASVPFEVPSRALAHAALDSVCRSVARLAQQHYHEVETLFRSHPRGDLRPPRLMGAVYSAMLVRMKKRGWLPPRERARIPKPVLLWFVLRHGLIV